MNARSINDKLAPGLVRSRLRLRLRRLLQDRRAATAVEYGLVVALIVLAMFAALAGVGNATSSMWNNVSNKVINAH